MNVNNIKQAVAELKQVLTEHFGQEIEVYVFGSVARNDHRSDSDIDVLVLLPGIVNHALAGEVIDLAYPFELEYDVVFGIVVYSKDFWASEKARVMPFFQNVQREALRI